MPVYEVSRQSWRNGCVDDASWATWAAATAALGEHAVVDLRGIVGYYTLLSIVMNGAQSPPPPDRPERLPVC